MNSVRNNSIALLVLLVSFILSNCNKKNPETHLQKSVIIQVEGNNTAKPGEEVILKVTLSGNNGCAVAGQLKEVIEGNVRVITGKVMYKGSVCPQVLIPVVVNYTFKAPTAGIYLLKFQKSQDAFIIHEINVM